MDDRRGVIDRIVDGHATVVVEAEDGGEEAEIRVPEADLPAGAAEGDVVTVREVTRWEVVAVDDAETGRRRTAVEERLERLRRERGGGRFGPRDGGDDGPR